MNGKRWILGCAYAAFLVSVDLPLSAAELQHDLAREPPNLVTA